MCRSATVAARYPPRWSNTRRIGGRPRAPDTPGDIEVPDRELGQPTELLGALKATGEIGSFRYGLLGAMEDDVKFDAPGRNLHQNGRDYGAVRLLYDRTRKTACMGVSA